MSVEFEINEKYEFFPVIIPNSFLDQINSLDLTELKLMLYLFSRINPDYKNKELATMLGLKETAPSSIPLPSKARLTK